MIHSSLAASYETCDTEADERRMRAIASQPAFMDGVLIDRFSDTRIPLRDLILWASAGHTIVDFSEAVCI